MVVFLGPTVSVILLTNIFDLDQELLEALHLPQLGTRRVIAFFAVVIILFLMDIVAKVWIQGPDLHTDSGHDFLDTAHDWID